MPKRVLLVDDAKVSRMIVGKIVEKLGHEVVGTEENGALGVEAYKSLQPDLVLSDVEMPVLDGYGLVEQIIAHDPDANIVMVTSVVNAQFIQRIIGAGAITAIKKPVNEEKLQKIFENLD